MPSQYDYDDDGNEIRSLPTRYPRHYRVRPLAEQVEILRHHLRVLPAPTAPLHQPVQTMTIAPGLVRAAADGWFAVPRYELVSEHYQTAVDVLLAALARTRPLVHWPQKRTESYTLSPLDGTARLMKSLFDRTDGAFAPLQAQTGRRFKGLAPKRVGRRFWGVMQQNEFCLGVFAVGCILLTHPERLVDDRSLWIDCAGDVCLPGRRVPYFGFANGALHFEQCSRWIAGPQSGSATGFTSSQRL